MLDCMLISFSILPTTVTSKPKEKRQFTDMDVGKNQRINGPLNIIPTKFLNQAASILRILAATSLAVSSRGLNLN